MTFKGGQPTCRATANRPTFSIPTAKCSDVCPGRDSSRTDETAKTYTVDALMQQPPSLAPVSHPSRAAVGYGAAYKRLSVLAADPNKGPYVDGYPVQDLAIVQGRNGPRVVVGYVAQTVGSPSRISMLEVQAWSIGQGDDTGDPKLQTRCVLRSDPTRRFFVAPLPGISYPTLLKEYWEQFDQLALC